MKPLFYLVIALYAVVLVCAGQLDITGHEEPLIIGVSRDIVCSWNGDANVTKMEWFLVGLGTGDAIETVMGDNSIVLTLNPGNMGLDGTAYTCRATLSDGQRAEESIILSVKALENIASIAAISSLAIAGESFILVCNVSSEREANLSWVDPNGVEMRDDPDTTVSYSGWNGGMSTLVLTINSIRTSESGVYKCISDIAVPPSKSEASFVVQVQIPEPTVTILRAPEHSVQLFTTDSLVLTCVIELIPEVDSYVAINSQWRGHSSLTDSERRVIVSELVGLHLKYNTSVTFNTLKTTDSGSYTCSATVGPQERNNHLISSSRTAETISISVALKVTIDVTYNPPSDFNLPSPPYYRPATSLTLTCRAHHPTGSVSYQWSSTCSNCFARSSSSQSITKTTLQSIDAGVHMCTATDGSENTGSNTTEMRMMGSGMYVQGSYYIRDRAVANNSLILRGSSSSTYINVYCYSNSTSGGTGYFKFPDGVRQYSTSRYFYYRIGQLSNTGVSIARYSRSYYPQIYGIFTCEVPDSRGITVETSIGIYASMPSPPSVYSISYSERHRASNDGVLGTVDCLTQNSPPTNVTWTRDGSTIEVDGEGYVMMQMVTERQSYSRYRNTLLIKDAAELAGNHSFCCRVSNAAGTTYQCVATSWTAHPDVHIVTYGKNVHSETFEVTCRASLQPAVAAHLNHYMTVDWIGADGQIINEEHDDITVNDQSTVSNDVTRSLVFDPLKMAHGGSYVCRAKLTLPGSAGVFQNVGEYQLSVLNMTFIQLKFGPVPHCSMWYEDKHMSRHLELDVKQKLTTLINKNCSCDFKISEIDLGEFSCRSIEKGYVLYRARLTGRSDTQNIPSLLEVIKDWIANDGTFLYTYHGNMRLGLDQDCPLEIASFSQPECGKQITECVGAPGEQ